jgi:uncharacterized protein YlxP (DUF503 family)
MDGRMISIGQLILYLQLPGCTSLKQKRSLIKPVLARLAREFNLSVAEVDRQDAWREAVLACVTVSSDPNQSMRLLQQVVDFTQSNWPDLPLFDHSIELI